MNTFYLHDGQNEAGPFTLDELKRQKISRNTPIRQKDTDKWMPAEKLAGLKPLVAPRKVKRPKDILPVIAENVSALHYQRPKALYGTLLGVALLTGISIYSIERASAKPVSKAAAEKPAEISSQQMNTAAAPKPEEAGIAKPAVKAETAKEDAAKASRLRWSKLVSATNSNYGIGWLGGIKDLSVIINNRSDYPLDEVVAKVTYIKAGGGVWKTVPITLYGVPPHDSKEQPVVDASRGKKVKVSLYKVVSKKMKLNYTEGKRGSDASDPFFKES
jgi:hypothetical protein